jgi:epoxyqueuosine reductase
VDPKVHIKAKARELGFDLCGVTSADPPAHEEKFRQWLQDGHHGEMSYMARRVEWRTDLRNVLPGAKSVIVAGMNYGRGARLCAPTGLIARYARGQDYHEFMGAKLEQLSTFIRSLGPSVQTKAYVDTGPVLERDLAQRAGIGWIGKHTNLISRDLGNWFFLGEILTTLELEPDRPEREYCGTCTRCITACPTQAIRAPYVLDARRCISYLTIELKGSIPVEFRPLIGNRIFGCDDCLEVCPWNRFAQIANTLKLERADLQQPDLIELMGLTEAQFRARFAGTPIARIKRRGLLRNVAVALGNAGGAEAIPVLERAHNEQDPLLQEHAAWALIEIRKRTVTPRGTPPASRPPRTRA